MKPIVFLQMLNQQMRITLSQGKNGLKNREYNR